MAATYQSVASAASATCSKPTGTVSGDLLVAFCVSVGAATTLAGWTQYAPATGNASSFYFGTVLYKVAGGSEPASYTFSIAGGIIQTVTIVRVDSFDVTTPLEAGSFAGATITAPTVTATSGALLIGYAGATADPNPPGSMTSRADAGPGATYSLYSNVSTESPAAGATGTRVFTTAGIGLVAGLVSVKQASVTTDATVTSVTGTGTALANVPDIAAGATLTPPVSAATALAQVPTVTSTATVVTPAATATATAPVPTIVGNAALTAPVGTATAAANVPVVIGGTDVSTSAVTATATALANVPSITTDALVVTPVATATALAPAPDVYGVGAVLVDAPTATALANAPTPAIVADALIVAVAATAQAAAYAAIVSADAAIDAPTATAGGTTFDPTTIIATVIDAAVATATGQAYAPFAGQTYEGTRWSEGSTAAIAGRVRGSGTIAAREHATGTVSAPGGVTATHDGHHHPSGTVRMRPQPTVRSERR